MEPKLGTRCWYLDCDEWPEGRFFGWVNHHGEPYAVVQVVDGSSVLFGVPHIRFYPPRLDKDVNQ